MFRTFVNSHAWKFSIEAIDMCSQVKRLTRLYVVDWQAGEPYGTQSGLSVFRVDRSASHNNPFVELAQP